MEKKIEEIAAEQIPYNEHKRAWFADGMKYVIEHPSQFNLVSQEDRNNPLINAARGRDACGINHDELNAAYEAQLKELQEDYDKLKQQADEMMEALRHIESVCDNQNNTHEGIWRIAYQTLTNYENQVR